MYVFTGKGGVGKSSVAMAFTKYLVENGEKAVYHCFDQGPTSTLCHDLNIPYFELDLDESSKKYIAKKLGSELIAAGVMKAPFFSSLLHMLPGLGHMILLGHLINKLEDDDDLIIVVDSPSSGHALTMFESSYNFKEIFKTGMLVKDIDRMHEFIYTDGRLKTCVICMPTQMAIQEGMELSEQLNKYSLKDIDVIMNDSLSESHELHHRNYQELPEFLRKKLELEQLVVSDLGTAIKATVPHITSNRPKEVIQSLVPLMEKLV